MTKIYNQGKWGMCSGYALANAIEETTGVVLTDQEITGLFENHGFSKTRGTRVENILHILKDQETIRNVKCTEWEKVYRSYKTQKENGFYMAKVRRALMTPGSAVIMVMRIRGTGKDKIPLEENVLVPTNERSKFLHTVHLKGFWHGENRRQLGYITENSWGVKWGDNGLFYLKNDHIFTEAHELLTCSFSK
jgi:hypothetical protein